MVDSSQYIKLYFCIKGYGPFSILKETHELIVTWKARRDEQINQCCLINLATFDKPALHIAYDNLRKLTGIASVSY